MVSLLSDWMESSWELNTILFWYDSVVTLQNLQLLQFAYIEIQIEQKLDQ